MAKKTKKIKLTGGVLDLFAKMDSEGGITDFIRWGGLNDDISLEVKKADPRLFAVMVGIKQGLDEFEKEAEKYEDYTGREYDNA